jgi:hypothetical protein
VKAAFGAHTKWQSPTYKEHVAALERERLTVTTAIARGYEPLTAEATRKETGQDVGPTIRLNCLKPDGTPHETQRYWIIDETMRKSTGKKYTQRWGRGVIVIHVRKPAKQRKKDGEAYITEGERKVDAIAEVLPHATVIGVPGVRSFKLDEELHPDIVASLDGKKKLTFAYDTDQEKLTIIEPLLEAADLIHAKFPKLVIQFKDLERLPNLKKTGADDLIQRKSAAAFIGSPTHDYDSDWVAGQRERIVKAGPSIAIPADVPATELADWYDTKPPPIDYQIEPYIQRGGIVQNAAQASVGKTEISLSWGVGMAGGVTVHGHSVPKPQRVMYVMLERKKLSLRRRYHRVTHQFADGLDPGPKADFLKLLRKNFHAKHLTGEAPQLVEFRDEKWQPSAAVDRLIEEIEAKEIEVVFFDTLSRLVGGNEMEAAAAIMQVFEQIVNRTGASVVFLHHTGKGGRTDLYAGRNSSVYTDNGDEVIVLSLVEGDERDGFKSSLQPHELFADIVKVSHERCSDGPRAKPEYFVRQKTGLLRSLAPPAPAAAVVGHLPGIRAWAAELKDAGAFSINQFVTAAAAGKIPALKLSKRTATQRFNDAKAAGLFVEIEQKRNGGALFRVAPEAPETAGVSHPSGEVRESEKVVRKSKF